MNEKKRYKKIFYFLFGFLFYPILWFFRNLLRNRRKPVQRVEQLNNNAREYANAAKATVTDSINSIKHTENTVEQCIDTVTNTEGRIEQCLNANNEIKYTIDRTKELLTEIKKQKLNN